jgi:signal transduction histidine kinase
VNQKNKEFHRIRPAARHILTIGRDLIKDSLAALVELVKNSYDADSEIVYITFEALENQSGDWAILKIEIKDLGHGMTFDTVVNKWMIPSTADKLKRKYSPGKKRLMQGRKGIGRYATAILGDEMWMETVDERGEKTQVLINWKDFEDDETGSIEQAKDESQEEKYLDEIEIPIETFSSPGEKPGTTIEITGGPLHLAEWSEKNIELLIKELKKIVSPIKETKKEDVFDIELCFKNFPIDEYKNRVIKIDPYLFLDLFDYRLSGIVQEEKIANLDVRDFPESNKFANVRAKALKNGNDTLIVARLKYENRCTTGIPDESFSDVIEITEGFYCGKVEFDLRVFDREPESIENLIKKSLADPALHDLGKREIKGLLNDMCGVSIYRGGFPIRPYGEPGYDWLLLDKRRVQEPSRRIGSNQTIGVVQVEAEELSHLKEKSARDGLKENAYYSGLKDIIADNIKKLEDRRYFYRMKTGRSRGPLKIEAELQGLFHFDELKNKIIKTLQKTGTGELIQDNINQLFEKTENDFNKALEKIRESIARYEGHITLGKIIMVLMHEGRKPLAALKNQVPNLFEYMNMIVDRKSLEELLPVIKKISGDLIKEVEFLVKLFERLNPLAVKRRKPKKFLLAEVLDRITRVFEGELNANKIKLSLEVGDKIEFYGWEEDFYIIFTNLIENSLYWLPLSHKDERIIKIVAAQTDGELKINFFDNGPGIEKQHIDENRIFEPGFSTKKDGTGLGLSIAGEAASRNNGELSAKYCENGTKLIARFKTK